MSGMSSARKIDSIKQLRETVVPELKEKARAMLCEYWGAGIVEKVEKLC